MKLFTRPVLSSLFLSLALGLSACGQNNANADCGNGTIEDGEQCDDGDLLDGDGCSSDCQLEEDECGDGTLSAGEQCDDGNTSNGDGCSATCVVDGEVRDAQIDSYIEGLGTLNIPAPLDETEEGAPTDTSYGPYQCTTQNFRQVKIIDSFKIQGGAIQSRIYPGMLLSGLSLPGGDFTEVIVDKKPLTLTHNVAQLPVAAIPLQETSLSGFNQGRTDLLVAQLGTQTFNPKFAKAFVETTVNEDELSLSLGVDISAGIATEVDVSGQFDFQSTTTQSRYLIRVVNELYTMNIDPVSFASDFFAEDVSLQDIQSLFQTGAPPVYVDSVTYGREVYISIESNFSEREVQLALDVAVANNLQQFNGQLDFGLTSKQVLEQSTVTGVVVGGVTGDAANLGDLVGLTAANAIGQLSSREAKLSFANLGEPISFTTRYLPSAFGNANSFVDASYPRESCTRLPVDFEVSVVDMNVTGIGDGNSSDAEIRGTWRVRNGQKFVDVFNRTPGNEEVFQLGVLEGPNDPFLSGTLQDVDATFNVGSTITVEFTIEEDDQPGLVNGDQGDGIKNDVDDIGTQSFTIAVEDLYKNGGIVPLNGINRAGLAFNLRLAFTPHIGLVP